MQRIMVELDGRPLRHTFVSARQGFDDPEIALTDGDGQAEFGGLAPGNNHDFVVHAHNLAVRMLDGSSAGVTEMSLRFRDRPNGATLNISKRNKKHFAHYLIMDRCYDVYDTVFASIPPFSGKARRAFPFGGSDREAHELLRSPGVDCRYPEVLVPGKLPWVQPQSVTSSVPLMHLKASTTDPKLFGTAKRAATTIPHEFAHAMHFALLPSLKRWELAAKYALWIGKELANGKSGTHRTDKKTSPLIAYIESIGIFSQRYYLFATKVRPDLRGARLRGAFVNDELSEQPSLAKVMRGYTPIATRRGDGSITPHLTGASTEGAVYGAIFLDLASRTDLATAVNLYLRCYAFDIKGYMSYANRSRDGKYRDAVAAVRRTWKLPAVG